MSLSVFFSRIKNALNDASYNQSRRAFARDLETVIEVFGITEFSDQNERVFKQFKKNYSNAKGYFEMDPARENNLPWQNFITLLEVASKDLHEQCNYFDTDIFHALAIESCLERLNDTWHKMPFEHKTAITAEGINFGGFENVQCRDFVEGIARSDSAKNVRAVIVTCHIMHTEHDNAKIKSRRASSTQKPR